MFLRKNTHLNYQFWGELAKFKQIVKLDLSNCTQIHDAELSIILRGLPFLKEFYLAGCKKINEGGFIELAKSLGKLTYLDVSRTNLSDTALVEIVSSCRYLTNLNSSSCPYLTEKGILAALKNSSLQSLNINHCSVSELFIREIRSNYDGLII